MKNDPIQNALAGLDDSQLTGATVNQINAENDSFVGWVQAMKQRFRDRMAAAGAGGRG